MKTSCLLVLLVGCLNISFGQPALQLSEKHLQKVLTKDNPVKKRKAYLNYYHKDSLRFVKETDRYWQAKFDSVYTIGSKQERIIKQRLEGVVKQGQNSLKRLETHLLLNPESYRFPPLLEAKYSQKQLSNIYSSMK